jgi:ABC-type glycerol-3-phosphate transport system substrate-binding protein
MWMGAFSERGGRSWGGAEWTMRWGMAPLPRGARSVTTGFVEGYGVAAQSPHPEAAWKWVLFLSEQIPQSSIPTRRSIVESPQFEESVGAEAASVARAVMAETVFINSGLLALEQPLQLYLDVIQAILTGEVSAAEAMAEAQSKLQP